MTLRERAEAQASSTCCAERSARAGHDELHPPAGAARARPRGVVRARTGRPRAVRAAAARRAGAARARLPRADDRCLAATSASDANIIAVEEVPTRAHPQYGVVGVGERKGKVFAITDMVEKPPREQRAVEPHHHRPLHPAAGDLRLLAKQAARRRRRDPAHRRDDRARAARSRSTASNSTAAASTAAPRSASSPPTSPTRWRARTSPRRSAPRSKRSSARMERRALLLSCGSTAGPREGGDPEAIACVIARGETTKQSSSHEKPGLLRLARKDETRVPSVLADQRWARTPSRTEVAL